ncbi:MAG: hypothetical protein ACXAB7_12250, partial [Candidatus Kariarchaeaceae archaeon]
SYSSGEWTNAENITINIDGLLLGVYNFTIVVNDTSNNPVTDDVIVFVIDTTNPNITHPSDITYEEGSASNEIVWNITDANPHRYIVYQNGTVNATGIWNSGIPFSINIDGLSLGVYNFTIVANDTSNNPVTDLIYVFVTDTQPPTLVASPLNVTYSEGTPGNTIQWNVTDYHPDMYTVYKNSTYFSSGEWTSTENITINIDGLSLGVYNFTIVVNDTSNHLVLDMVYVFVTDDQPPLLAASPFDVTYSEGTPGNTIQWNVTDNHPHMYTVYKNGTSYSKSGH